jgi:hypothetical protein
MLAVDSLLIFKILLTSVMTSPAKLEPRSDSNSLQKPNLNSISLRKMFAIFVAVASLIGKAQAYLEQYSINVKDTHAVIWAYF